MGEDETTLWLAVHHYVDEARKRQTLLDGKGQLLKKCWHPGDIGELCMDMPSSFMADARTYFPCAEVTHDKFHVMKIIDTAAQRAVSDLKNRRYVWLKNEGNLTDKQRQTLIRLKDEDLKTAKAYHLKLTFSNLWEQENAGKAKAFLDDGFYWATHSQIPDMVKAAKTIRQREQGILRLVHIQGDKRDHGSD